MLRSCVRLQTPLLRTASSALKQRQSISLPYSFSSPIVTRLFTSSPSHPKQVSEQVRMEALHDNQKFRLENVFNVKDKVALVTGGGSGIGLMATQALAVNGARVYITGRTPEKLQRVADLYSQDIPGQIIPIAADVTNKDSIQKLTDTISAREKAVHILINNAGITNAKSQNTELSDAGQLRDELFPDKEKVYSQEMGKDVTANSFEEWENIFRTNVAQVYYVTSSFLPLLQRGSDVRIDAARRQSTGYTSSVINISSISGLIKSSQHHFAYNASKAAVNHLTKMLAHEITSSGLNIRVNNIAPGVFPSEMTAASSDEKQKSSLPYHKYQGRYPANRPGEEEDMASTVLFVSTNQFLNGQTIVVDGGYVLATGTV